MPRRGNPHSCSFISSCWRAQNELEPAEQDPLVEMLLRAALCVDQVHLWNSGSGRSRGIRGGGQALLSPSSPPALLPPPLVPALAPARFHLSHKVLQPTAFGSFSFAASSQQPAVRLNHSRISSCECALPSQKRSQVCCATLTSHFLRTPTGVILAWLLGLCEVCLLGNAPGEGRLGWGSSHGSSGGGRASSAELPRKLAHPGLRTGLCKFKTLSMQEARARGLFRNASPFPPPPPATPPPRLALWGVRLLEIGDPKDKLKFPSCRHRCLTCTHD